jgi:hypothetical protein
MPGGPTTGGVANGGRMTGRGAMVSAGGTIGGRMTGAIGAATRGRRIASIDGAA